MEFYYHDTDGDVLILNADGGLAAVSAEEFVGELERAKIGRASCRERV